jgi:hypothetical protein
VLLLYVSADFANPLLPGAVQLDPGESIDAVYRSHPGHLSSPALAHWRQPEPPAIQDRVRIGPLGSSLLALPGWHWFLPHRPPRQPADDLTAFSTEDH